MERARLTAWAVVALLPMAPLNAAHAAWSSDPAVSVSACDAPNDQWFVRGCIDGAGGVILAWSDDRASDQSDVYAQRVDALGNVLWDSLGVVVDTSASIQNSVQVVADHSGGAFVMWMTVGTPYEVWINHLDSSGSLDWPAKVRLSSGILDGQITSYRGCLAEDGLGGAIATWHAGDGSVAVQRLDSGGGLHYGASGTVVASPSTSSTGPSVASDGAGGAIVAWRDFRTFTAGDIYAQKVDASGNIQWVANGVPVVTESAEQGNPVLAYDGAGGAFVAWKDSRSMCHVYAQHVDATGSRTWSTDGIDIGSVAFFCGLETIVIAPDGAGGAIIGWDGSANIWAQRVDATGSFQWGSGALAVCTASGAQTAPELVVDGAGDVLFAWEDRRSGVRFDIYGQYISAAGVPQWAANGDTVSWLSLDSRHPDVVLAGTGQMFVAFHDDQSGSRRNDIMINLFPPPVTTDVEPSGESAGSFALRASPNPGVGPTRLQWNLSRPARVRLAVYDVAGRRLRTLVDAPLAAGSHEVEWDGRDAGGMRQPGGLYFVRLTTDSDTRLSRVVMLGR